VSTDNQPCTQAHEHYLTVFASSDERILLKTRRSRRRYRLWL